jgi:single-stranded-DNA-specific exonuclease
MTALPISLSDINMQNYEILRTFSPFGEGFKEPAFLVTGLKAANLSFISNDKHLSTIIGMNVKLLGFNIPRQEVNKSSSIDLYGNMQLNEFRGRYTLEFRVSSYRATKLL